MPLLNHLFESKELTPVMAIGLVIYGLCLIYVISGVIGKRDNYIWIAVAFAVPPIAALMYYLEKRRERSKKSA